MTIKFIITLLGIAFAAFMLNGCMTVPDREIKALYHVGCDIGRYYRNSERGELEVECEQPKERRIIK